MRRALLLTAAPRCSRRRRPPRPPPSTTMVAGKQRVLRAAKPVKLADTRRVKVGSRRCTVVGRDAARRARRDLAGDRACATTAPAGAGRADAASLFVTRIGRRAQPRPGRLGLQGRPQGLLGRGGRPLRPPPARRRPAAVVLLPLAALRRLPAHARGDARPHGRGAGRDRPRHRARLRRPGPRHRRRRRDRAARLRHRDHGRRRRGAASSVPAAGRLALGATRTGMVPAFPGWSAPDEARPRHRHRARRAGRGRVRLRPRPRRGDGGRGLADRHAGLRRGADRPPATWPA